MMKILSIKPSIIVIRGPIGSGKSTTACLLRKQVSNASMIDYDVFKRMIDNTKSTKWRQNMAFETAMFLLEKIIKNKRSIIIDIHSAKDYQYIEIKKISRKI